MFKKITKVKRFICRLSDSIAFQIWLKECGSNNEIQKKNDVNNNEDYMRGTIKRAKEFPRLNEA